MCKRAVTSFQIQFVKVLHATRNLITRTCYEILPKYISMLTLINSPNLKKSLDCYYNLFPMLEINFLFDAMRL